MTCILLEEPLSTNTIQAMNLSDNSSIQTIIQAYQHKAPWLHQLKQQAFEKFKSLPTPSQKDEAWRFFKSKQPELASFEQASKLDTLPHDISTHSNFISSYAAKLLFVNDYREQQEELSETLRNQGVIFMPISEAINKHPQLLQSYFLKNHGSIGSDKYWNLHASMVQEGTLLYVPKNVQIDLPFIAYHWQASQNTALFPHTLIIAEENTSVNLIDVFQSTESASTHPAFICGTSTVIAKENASVFYKFVQNWGSETFSLLINDNVAEKHAKIKSTSLNIGSKTARVEAKSHIKGDSADVKMHSLTIASQDQEMDQRTFQSHEAPHTTSDLLYKNALLDNAHTIFSGLIRVSPEAQQTDAYQTNRNLLLSTNAQTHSLPGLEIEANDVKCSHGATSSMINPQELFYLQARGINKTLAHELLIFGFFEEILQKFENTELTSALHNLIQQKLEKASSIAS